MDFLSTAIILDLIEVFLFLESGSGAWVRHVVLASVAGDPSEELALERFDGLLTLRVVHVDVDTDLLSGLEAQLIKRDCRFGL